MNSEAKLEEYRQVSESKRQLLKRQDRDIYFVFLVFIGVISVGFRWQYSILYMTSSFILLYLWLDEIRIFNSIYRCATYIEVFIEKDISDLKFHTRGGEHHLHKKRWLKLSRALANAIIPLLSLVFFHLAIHLPNKLVPKISYSNLIIFLYRVLYMGSFWIAFAYLEIWSIISTFEGRKKEKKEWERIQELKKED